MPITTVTTDDVTTAEAAVNAAKADVDALAAQAATAYAAGAPVDPTVERAPIHTRNRFQTAQHDLDQARAGHRQWMDDRAGRPGREKNAAAPIAAAGKDIDTAGRAVTEALTAAQHALVALLDAGRSYDEAIRSAASLLDTHGLHLDNDEEHATGTGHRLVGGPVVRIAGADHIAPDPAVLVQWTVSRVAGTRLGHGHPLHKPVGPHRDLETRSARLVDGVPPVPVQNTRGVQDTKTSPHRK
ncbi:hypothetical protein [Parafrankia sp. FMc2]|uniref:hypothetical protein n=1 Tax=Parafrankia sp. FMc2 TaxID=3233196 RepID=UPI0034D6F99E